MTRRPEGPAGRRREAATRQDAAAQRRAAADARRRLVRERQAQQRLESVRARGTRRAARRTRRTRRTTMPPHARRRRRLLRWSAFPAGLLLMFALSLLPLRPGYEDARALYDEDDHWAAVEAFDAVDDGSFVELWKGAFNRGTARYRAGSSDGAIRWLDEALEGVPDEHRCDVQTNRALALLMREEEHRANADAQLELAREVAEALAAKEAGEPYDEEVLEVLEPYDDEDEPRTLADEIGYAGYLLRLAAEDAALAAEALADPACTPPPSGGAAEDEQDDQGGGGGQDEQQDQGGQGSGADAQDDAAAQAEQRMLQLLDLAAEVERMAQASEAGTLDGVPEPGQGQVPDAAQAEEQRQAELAERNGQAGGGAGGDGTAGRGSTGGGASGDGDEKGDGQGGSPRRNW